MGETPESGIMAGIGKGVLGMFSKPISGAMDLVHQTSRGIINSAGLQRSPNRVKEPAPKQRSYSR